MKTPMMKAVNDKAKMHSKVSGKSGKGATSVPGSRYNCGTMGLKGVKMYK